MSCAVEVRLSDGRWHDETGPVLGRNRNAWLGRNRNAWDALFGNGAYEVQADRPLFPDEELPDDVSASVREAATAEGLHSHRRITWAQVAAAGWDAPLSDTPSHGHVGEWRPGADGELVLHDVVWADDEFLETASDLFGGDIWFVHEWPSGSEVHLHDVVYRPVFLTARMFAPPDEEPWAELWTTMRDLAAIHGDDNVRLLVWFG
jgi:hypothetical protein